MGGGIEQLRESRLLVTKRVGALDPGFRRTGTKRAKNVLNSNDEQWGNSGDRILKLGFHDGGLGGDTNEKRGNGGRNTGTKNYKKRVINRPTKQTVQKEKKVGGKRGKYPKKGEGFRGSGLWSRKTTVTVGTKSARICAKRIDRAPIRKGKSKQG